MTRQDAFQTLQVYTKSTPLIRHHLAVEASMRALARVYAGRKKGFVNEESWGLVGLLHDADYELTRKHPEQHTIYLEGKIGKIVPADVMYSIKAHNVRYTGIRPITAMDWALYACDELTGFIVMCALEQKEKRLSLVTTGTVITKMENSSFAKSVDRAQILSCEQMLGFSLKEFVGVVLSAMQSVAIDLGFES